MMAGDAADATTLSNATHFAVEADQLNSPTAQLRRD
jgi:hypothetical protein